MRVLGIDVKKTNKMKIDILWVGAEGTVPRQCMYSVIVEKGLRITLKCSTLFHNQDVLGLNL
jgi:hypothetical protein